MIKNSFFFLSLLPSEKSIALPGTERKNKSRNAPNPPPPPGSWKYSRVYFSLEIAKRKGAEIKMRSNLKLSRQF